MVVADLIKTISLPTPTLKQEAVLDVLRHSMRGERVIVGWGGAMGGGKTMGAVIVAHQIARAYPGARILIGRDELKSLKTTTMEMFYLHTPKEMIARRDDQDFYAQVHYDDWPDDVVSTIFFRGVHDAEQFQSEEYTAVILDECERIPEDSAYKLITRLRQKPRGITPKYMLLCLSNPSPGWFEEWFDPERKGIRKMDGQKMRDSGVGDIIFIPARMSDNPHLDANYEAMMRASLPKAMAERYIDGSFNVFEGQIFDNFQPTWHCLSQRALRESPLKTRTIVYQGREMVIPEFVEAIGGLDFAGANVEAHFSTGVVRLLLPGKKHDVACFEFKDRGANVRQRQQKWMKDVERAIGRRVIWVADKTQPLGISFLREFGFEIHENKGKPDSWETNVHTVRERFEKAPGREPASLYLAECIELERQLRGYRIDNRPRADGTYKLRAIGVNDDLVDAYLYSTEWFYGALGDPAKKFKNAVPYRVGRSVVDLRARFIGRLP